MSNYSMAVNDRTAPRAPRQSRRSDAWTAEQKAAYHAACQPAERLYEQGKLARADVLVYRKLVRLCVDRCADSTTADHAYISTGIPRCSTEYVTVVYRKLKRLGLIRREPAGALWRSYVVELEPKAEGAATVPEPPAAVRASLVWSALALLQQAFGAITDPAQPLAAPGTADSDSAPVDRTFFAPSAPDLKAGSIRLKDRLSPSLKDSGLITPGADAPQLHGGGDQLGDMARAVAVRREPIPETETVARLRAFGVAAPSVLRAHAHKPLADVERLIRAVEHWPEPLDNPVGMLVVLLDEGLWPERARQIEVALARAEAAARTAAGPLVCAACHAVIVFEPGAICLSCARAPDSAQSAGVRCAASVTSAEAHWLIAQWGMGTTNPGILPAWLVDAADGGAP